MPDSKPKLLVLVGPTASGKTSTAIALAKALDGEIISADSRYFFRELQIGTAKPTLAEQAQVTHHLINVTNLSTPWSLGEYKIEVEKLIFDINARDKLPILVGGSGQYIRAITQNWSIPEQEPDHKLRDVLERVGRSAGYDRLYTYLSWLDTEAARAIDARNHRRTVRALEVILLSGKRFSDLSKSTDSNYQQIIIGLDWSREVLYQRVDARIDQMFADGLVIEVQTIIAAGLGRELRKVGIIGYAEILDYLEGKTTLKEAVMLIRRNTRRFIRHQANWFKPNDPAIHWFKAQDPATVEQMLGLVKDKLYLRLTE